MERLPVIRAVLFDRDGTLIDDAPPPRNPVRPMHLAARALSAARARGLRVGVITNQPAIAGGTITRSQMHALHERIEGAVGAIGAWFVCPHASGTRCGCRKPRPGLIFQAAERFGISPAECAVIGDIGSDIEAARAAGARSVLVPTPVTLKEEIERAPLVADNLLQAVKYVLALESGAR